MGRLFGGVEAGGTKFVCVIGTEDGQIHARERIATRDPTTTINDTCAFFLQSARDHGPLDAIGIATFGPVELRQTSPTYGHIGVTPKPDWSHTDLVGPLAALGVPVAIDTDVNGAALGEARWGAAQGLDHCIYITVGTGIGAGAIVDGDPVHGLVHPEMGHVSVPRHPDDRFAGACPFHGDCLEGMASGPALQARWGRPAEQLHGHELERAVDIEAHYVAAGIRNLVYTLAPQRVVIGGSVRNMPGLFERIRHHLTVQLAGYPGLPEHTSDDFVVPAGCGDDAGTLGALALAARATAG